MSRFFFDVYDDQLTQVDDTGQDLCTMEQVRKEAQRLLPEIAYHEIPMDGDHRSFLVLVRDEVGKTVYTAALNYQGHKVGIVG